MKKLIITLALGLFFLNFTQAQCNDKVLNSFGGISAMAMYNTYVGIGAIADGYSVDKYESDYVITLMNEQANMMEVVLGMLDEVVNDYSANSVSEEDRIFINEIKVALGYLKNEATALKNYATAGSSIDDYTTNRELAWEKISELLGLEE